MVPAEPLSKLDISRSLSYGQARIAGLQWQRIFLGSECVAWEKDQFDRSLLPELVGIKTMEYYQAQDHFDFLRFVYRTKF